MNYNVGDKVRIKSLDWYNENKDEDDNVVCLYSYFDKGMSEFCDKIVTIKSLHGCPNVKAFRIIEDNGYSWWSDDMIEGLVKDTITTNEQLNGQMFVPSNISLEKEMEWNLPNGYIFKDENGNEILTSKIILEKKKEVTYPKTYAECCKVLGVSEFEYNHTGTKMWYRHKLMAILDNLMLCRDAYWKIAGDEMGLEKPWELSIGTPIYYIYYNRTVGTIKNDYADDIQGNIILAFPTAEMRDAFYENFKELIESVKELL